MVLILIPYCKISKPNKAFDFAQIVQEKQTRSVFKSWLTNSSSDLPEGAMIALKKVVLIGLRDLFIYDDNTEARQNFFQSHTDLYTVDIAFRSKSGNDIAASLDLSKYEFLTEEESPRKRGRSNSTKGERSTKG